MTLALRGWYPGVSGLIEVEVREGMATDLGGCADLSLCTVAGGRRLGDWDSVSYSGVTAASMPLGCSFFLLSRRLLGW